MENSNRMSAKNNKHNAPTQAKQRLSYLLTSCLFFISSIVFAQSNDFSLGQISQLSNAQQAQWQQLFPHPSRQGDYFAFNNQGQLYLITSQESNSEHLLIDLNSADTAQSKRFTAFTLHPNFNLKDQKGFATFYTAHVEQAKKNRNRARLSERSAKADFDYDAVLTQWQLSLANLKKVDSANKREVLRIALTSQSKGINQLAFNPYIKSWNENFGLLYLALSATKDLQAHPLYSGAILRINPKKYGLRNYSIPNSNPFLRHNNINDAIYTLGNQDIQQFVWPDKNSEQLLISHHYQENDTLQQRLSLSSAGDDWRNRAPAKTLYKSALTLNEQSMLVYRGRNTPSLLNKLLLVQNTNSGWQLFSLASLDNQAPSKVLPPQLEWQFNQHTPKESTLTLHADANGELLFFNGNDSAIYQLHQHNKLNNKATDQQSNTGLVVSIVLAIFVLIFWYFAAKAIKKKHSAKTLVRKQYATISFDENSHALTLYRRHEKTNGVHIKLADIRACQVLLGDNCLVEVNSELAFGFDNELEHKLRDTLKKEHADKMIEGKVRRLSLVLTDHDKQNYVTCLYLRKGNNRITKKSYFEVVDDLVEWCWLIAQSITPEQTGKRDKKPRISAEEVALYQHRTHDETPLHKQAAAIRPATHQVEPADKPVVQENTIPERPTKAATAASTEVEPSSKQHSSKEDTELVIALEKLVKLQKQGFLSADEFAQAKAKLLKNLID